MIQTSLLYFSLIFFLSLIYNFIEIKRLRIFILLLTSILLYASFNIGFLFLLFFIITITFLGAISISKNKNIIFFYTIIVLLILPLIYYKYFLIWFDYNEISFLPKSSLNFGGYGSVIIPVGLSFFTFQSIGYLIDVRKSLIKAEKNYFLFFLFISYFPQLLAGPIERYKNLFHQLKLTNKATPEQILDGILYILYGIFLKYCLADKWGKYSDVIFNDTKNLSSLTALVGNYAFTIQLYGDFLGYSLIALGTSYLFGINLSKNFKQPFFSTNINEFWQRWHITLTSWVFDYVYKPLVVELMKIDIISLRFKVTISSLITWLILGLWHGANITFLVFGLMQFLFIQIRILFKKYFNLKYNIFLKFIMLLITFHSVVFSFSLIRSSSLLEYYDLIISLISFKSGLDIPGEIKFYGVFVLLIVFLVDFIRFKNFKISFFERYILKFLYILILIFMIIFLSNDYNRAYIYFRF